MRCRPWFIFIVPVNDNPRSDKVNATVLESVKQYGSHFNSTGVSATVLELMQQYWSHCNTTGVSATMLYTRYRYLYNYYKSINCSLILLLFLKGQRCTAVRVLDTWSVRRLQPHNIIPWTERIERESSRRHKGSEQLSPINLGSSLKTRLSHPIEWRVTKIISQRYWDRNEVLRYFEILQRARRSISILMCDHGKHASTPEWHVRYVHHNEGATDYT